LRPKIIGSSDRAFWSQLAKSALARIAYLRPGLSAPDCVPIVFKDLQLDCGYRLDVMVKDSLVVEIMPLFSRTES
jgi:hypothetical protein